MNSILGLLVKLFVISYFILGIGCVAVSEKPEEKIGLANPASVNCVQKGGQIKIEKDGTGAEYGVCLFEDNRQCEEWALYRERCRVGGIKVTGYLTDAARYCAIRGGKYRITSQQTLVMQEQGTCELKGGRVCDAQKWFSGGC
jgi:putative hemolysin